MNSNGAALSSAGLWYLRAPLVVVGVLKNGGLQSLQVEQDEPLRFLDFGYIFTHFGHVGLKDGHVGLKVAHVGLQPNCPNYPADDEGGDCNGRCDAGGNFVESIKHE